MRTGVIQYNLNDRGRELTGKPRHFNIDKVAAFINGARTQERIQKRDMFGYYGHWPRVKFGMMPPEGGIYQGKLVKLEPAISTIHLKAFPDGTIEHEEEFLETDAGRTAQKMFESKKGGFSSALSEVEGRFFGFDYVNEPNFDDNRGYVLDTASADDGGAILDDAVIADYNQNLHGMLALLDSAQTSLGDARADHERALMVIARLEEENEQYLAMLAGRQAALDSAGSLPMMVSKAGLNAMRADAAEFKRAILPGIVVPDQPEGRCVDNLVNRLLRR
ncbi:hypothetical protein BCF11_0449 [Collimonas sp. PA-H2]|uniref:hypothetical protein n=1 Tax=Collimonas sp. PA-H2 TaxID=1881062 RepID=UPI000C005098|nr:hypothetical protein [Collimonas sp. PA-H2]PFH08097.1 hypothetical protein BCF11_0449 [Collimonas sp. PA-H2]